MGANFSKDNPFIFAFEMSRFLYSKSDFTKDLNEGIVSKFVCAQGHHKSGAKNWAEACGFKYMSANSKENFLEQFDSFCNDECDKPMIFEVFTTMQDDKRAQEIVRKMK